jgi:uncharacterized membrane protein YphA (DoxX/SURF4 family)/ElaB/YqjD/DUF883 family membrane-anchored ribosome-binding protein
MLASAFVGGGIDTLRDPEPRVKASESVTMKLAEAFGFPDNPELLVKLNAGIQVGGGLLLAVGKFRRLSALALIGSIVPTTLAGHRFWELEDPEQRAQQRMHFLKNLGLLGGLVLELVDTEGAPSIGWKTRRAARRAGVVISSHAHSPLSHSGHGHDLGGHVHELGDHVHELASRAGEWVTDAATLAAAEAAAGRSAGGHVVTTTTDRSRVAAKAAVQAAKHAADYANRRTGDVSQRVEELWDPDRAAQVLKSSRRRATKALKASSELAAHVLATQAGHASELLAVGAERAEDVIHRAEDAVQRTAEHLPHHAD